MYLTLTSVVFEFHDTFKFYYLFNLTLTSVVFEFYFPSRYDFIFVYLTLTSVVFESAIKKEI